MQSLGCTAKYQDDAGRKTLLLSFDMTHQRVASVAVVVKNALLTKLITTNLSLLGLNYQVLALHQMRSNLNQHQAVVLDQLPSDKSIIQTARDAHPWLRFIYLVSFDTVLQQKNMVMAEDEWTPILDSTICVSPLDKVALTEALFTPRKDKHKAPRITSHSAEELTTPK